MKKIILKTITCPNGAIATHHAINRIEIGGDLSMAAVSVHSWTSEAALTDSRPPSWNWQLSVPVTGDFVDSVATAICASGDLQGGQVTTTQDGSIEVARTRKLLEINAARLTANKSGFTFAGKRIATDELSRGDIDAVASIVARTGALPAGWPGAWKAIDNTFVEISDAATWDAFYTAMYATGLANFSTSQTLKAQVAAAITAEEIAAIQWPAE